ncbi:unnamed protein product [Clavelina lepadiformis]|uniref:Protein SPT2 homolog n=1 Tax=Clavelina lepadiformis TaxID=159417 RepID=A0ABP0FNA3_CLALP
MDIHAMISQAKKNQKEMENDKKIGYTTQVRPPQKLQRTVNPDAIKAFLKRKKEMEKIQTEEKLKKKQNLRKLRDEQKHTKKAKAMASRTKDNMQGYKGDAARNETSLSPEEERMHKAFMNKVKHQAHPRGPRPFDQGGDRKKLVNGCKEKSKKHYKESKHASNFNYSDLINLAQEQASKWSDDSSSFADDSSDEELDPNKRYEREKRKRKELEAQIKALKSGKHKADSANGPAFKVPKLDKGMSEENKQEKVKAILAKFNKKSQNKSDASSKSIKPLDRRKGVCSSATKKTPNKFKTVKQELKKRVCDQVPKTDKKPNGSVVAKSKFVKKPVNNQQNNAKKDIKKVAKLNDSTKSFPKTPSNPYAELMAKAKEIAGNKCTLSVKPDVVRTNYPGVSMTDPKNATIHKVKAPSRDAIIAAYSRRGIAPTSLARRPHARIHDDDEDEYDPEMDDFIDDCEDGLDHSISAEIGAIFGYNKFKYGRESEYELSKMDASFKDIEREEKRSLRIAQEEDAKEAKLEEERNRKRKK